MIYLTHFCLLFQFEPHETFAYASYGSAKTQTATKMHQKKKAENTELLQRDMKQPQRYNYKETQTTAEMWNCHKDAKLQDTQNDPKKAQTTKRRNK